MLEEELERTERELKETHEKSVPIQASISSLRSYKIETDHDWDTPDPRSIGFERPMSRRSTLNEP